MVIEIVKFVEPIVDQMISSIAENANHNRANEITTNSTSGSIHSTNLIDVNFDCVEKILNILTFNELLCIADTNKHLREAAEIEFTRRYGKRTVWLDFIPDSMAPTANVQEKWIKINDLKTCLQTLRCFGHLITNLHVTGVPSMLYCREIEQAIWIVSYVTSYCSKTLSQIIFSKCSCLTLNHLSKPFVSVKSVRFEYCNVEQTLATFNHFFPMARELVLLWTDVAGIGTNIRNLQHLEINMSMNLNTFQMEHVEAIIKSNPQLRRLKLILGCDVAFLHAIGEHLQSIEDLEIGCFYGNSEANNINIHLKSVKNFKLHTNEMAGGHCWPTNAAFTFDKLQAFTLERSCWWNDELIHSIGKHSNVTKLIINSKFCATVSESVALKMANTMQSLNEIDVRLKRFSVDEAMYFLNGLKSLRKLSFTLAESSEFSVLIAKIDDKKWKATIDDDTRVTLQIIT